MDPKITCLDTAVYLTNPEPEEVVVGSVISFKNPADDPHRILLCPKGQECRQPSTYGCWVVGDRISHRVVGIKVEGGKYYYRTKGDNNTRDDGCWLPYEAVIGYIISLTKGTDSIMEALLQDIWDLEKESKSLESLAIKKGAELDYQNTRYDEVFWRYCGFSSQREPGRFYSTKCRLGRSQYNHVHSLWVLAENLRLGYNKLISDRKFVESRIDVMRVQLQGLRCSRLKMCPVLPQR